MLERNNTVLKPSNALDIIHERTDENPLQTFIDAIIESAPCEETTRIKMGAVQCP